MYIKADDQSGKAEKSERVNEMTRCRLAVAAVLFITIINAYFLPLQAKGEEASELTASSVLELTGGKVSSLTDGAEKSYTTIPSGGALTITAKEGIGSLYLIFDRIYGEWTLTEGEADVFCGQNDFLHEYIDVAAQFGHAPTTVTLRFENGDCALSEVHVFGTGEVPAWVQKWEPPCEAADLMLFSTHVDDEQLFFAGILPYYAGECGLAVQVAYFTDPFSYHDRPHEQLNGLWTVGVRNYPVCGPFPDAYSESAADAYAQQEKYGYTKEDMVRFQVELLRRFKPHVAVGHDKNGEYGHGQHRINSETLMEALELAADENYDTDSAAAYGVWDTPKAYIHLWKENPLVMDWDVPLEAFGGKTAFQVTQEGFLCHTSQQWTWFKGWIFGKNGNVITKAKQIRSYSPCLYGLYRSTVGLDEQGGDMFENIPQSYAEIKEEERLEEEQERLQEEKERLEEEKRLQEEQERLQEEQERLQEEKRLQEDRERLQEAKRLQKEQSRETEGEAFPQNLSDAGRMLLIGLLLVAILLAVVFTLVRAVRRRK